MSAFYTTVARFYDAENRDKTDDLAMYSRLAAECEGGILDVGCGTGRVLIHLAQAGHHVCGIDNDSRMLERLERKLAALPNLREKISYVNADVLRHDFERAFGLILLTYNALMHFKEQDEQVALLGRLRRWLAEDGVLVIDLPNAGPVFASEDTDAMTLERIFIDDESGHMIMLQSVSALDRAAQLLHIDWIYDEIDGDGRVNRHLAPHTLRYFFLPELRLLLQRCGFALDKVYGDTEDSDYVAESERMIVHASRC
ncbi:MAG: class I SAM-dependent methyltransferase [Chloroflexota bacterium]|nr:class I SAM-dependent methyltransferase [Chloroflexota bacterium]MDE2911037.1 class I SAM-dependent methyltransferase [Chloroflexota bacterium]